MFFTAFVCIFASYLSHSQPTPLSTMAPQLLLSLPFPGSPTMVLSAPSPSSSSSTSKQHSILESVCLHNQLPISFASHLRLSRSGRPWDGALLEQDLLGEPFVVAEVAMRLRGGAPKKRCQHAKNSLTESQCSQPALREYTASISYLTYYFPTHTHTLYPFLQALLGTVLTVPYPSALAIDFLKIMRGQLTLLFNFF